MSGISLAMLTQVMGLRVNLVNARTYLREACRNLGLSDDDSAAPDAPAQVAMLAHRLARATVPVVSGDTPKQTEGAANE